MRRTILLPLFAVVGLLTAACVQPTPPPPDPGPDLCQPGFFSADGEEPCTPAPAGTFVAVEGATEATLCAPGTYQDQSGQTSCIPAPSGSYVAFAGAAEASLCEFGSFQALEGQTSCTPAPAGSFVNTSGAAAATLCPLGRYQPNAGQFSCILAAMGTYVDTTGAIESTPCPPGTTTVAVGSTSSSDCVPATPVLTSITPGSGNIEGGYTAQLAGVNLTGTTTVDFGSAAVPVSSVTDELIEFVVPPYSGTPSVNVSVSKAGATSNVLTFAYAAPTITELTPSTGPAGTIVTIRGSNFTPDSVVGFGGIRSLEVDYRDATTLKIQVPSAFNDPRSFAVRVTTPMGTSNSAAFDLQVVPVIDSIDPVKGAPGTSVTITGQAFTSDATVRFGSLPASVTSVNATQIVATVPGFRASQIVDVRVTTPSGISNTLAFSVTT